ncbi:MAG: hypothetical protein LBT14_01295 [Treponema sp.]|jgi:hypothetical protein|nr:hypothetical protein [Treponema sp.]
MSETYKMFFCLMLLVSRGEAQEREAPYLIPQTVYVGDKARLVVPLGQAPVGSESIVLEQPGELPASQDLIISRIAVEHREGNVRLLIDFIAYAPGVLALPPLEIPALVSRGFLVSDLRVTITSILNGDSMILSEAVAPLPVPGTIMLIYGTAAGLVLLILLGIGLRLWGKGTLNGLEERFRRRRLIRLLKKRLRQVRKDREADTGGHDAGEVLTLVSTEFRAFLTSFTGINCRAMAAGELVDLPPLVAGEPGNDHPILSGSFLARLFRRCDTLRFSGTSITPEALLAVLDGIQQFINTLDHAEKERNRLWKNGFSRVPEPAEGTACT